MRMRTPPPLPAWVAGFAADALPDDLSWKKMRVEYDTIAKNWNVRIEGSAPRDPLRSARLLQEYQALLSSPRTGISIKTPWRVSWIQSLRTGGTWEADNLRKTFVIEGGLQ
jgi:hypothetical protein